MTPRSGQRLTDIERHILRGIANGHSNIDIANRMCRSPFTVKSHVADILIKLDAHNRAHAVRIGCTAGLITPDDIHTPTGARP